MAAQRQGLSCPWWSWANPASRSPVIVLILPSSPAHLYSPLARLFNVIRYLGLILAASSLAFAQAPTVGEIDFYGLRSVSAQRILSAVHLKPGDPIPPSKAALEDQIAEIPGVLLARVEAVCCEGPKAALFIGIEEKGAPHAAFRTPPSGDAALPEELVNAYALFLTAVQRAAGQGTAVEDLTAGHSLMADPQARAYQERFVSFATDHLEELRSVLRNGSDPEQRAIAAAVLGYAPKKQDVVNDLQFAVQDPDESVRANAVRALNAFAVAGIKVSPTWFFELLHSVILSDRTEAVRVLLTLTDRGGADVLQQLKDRSLPELAEMARWKAPRYALPPFLLLARAAGLTDQQAQQSWQKGERETVIQKSIGTGNVRKRQPALQ